jgi:hypothetical protein
MRTHQIIAIAAVLLAAAPIARADQASTLKQQGLKAAQDKNWEVARDRFEQSYALDPRPLTLFNLAVAQEHTEKLIEARASYTTFLEQVPSGENEQFRKLATDAIPALDKAIPTLHIRVTGLAAGDAVELDGRAQTIDAAIPLDPGSHGVVVRRGREAIAQRTVTLVRAARDDVELAVPIVPPVLPPRVEPPPEPATKLTFERPAPQPAREHTSVLRSGWFWGVTTVVVLAAAAGTGFYYLDAPTHAPTRGTLSPSALPVP